MFFSPVAFLLVFSYLINPSPLKGLENPSANVTAESLRVRSAPNISSDVIGGLKKGARLDVVEKTTFTIRIDGEENFWYLVTSTSGISGWVFGEYIDLHGRVGEISYSPTQEYSFKEFGLLFDARRNLRMKVGECASSPTWYSDDQLLLRECSSGDSVIMIDASAAKELWRVTLTEAGFGRVFTGDCDLAIYRPSVFRGDGTISAIFSRHTDISGQLNWFEVGISSEGRVLTVTHLDEAPEEPGLRRK